MKNTRRKMMSILGATALATVAMPSLAEDVVTLRLHQMLPEQANVPAHVLTKWMADVEEATGGSVKVEMYSAMTLGGTPPELYDQAVDGVADITWAVIGYSPGRFSETETFELPFMITTDAGRASKAFWKFAENHLIDDEMSDTHVLGLWMHGPGLIHSKDPIRSVDDLQGVKLRAPTRTTNMLFTNLGAEPIGMPVPAVPENLSKGVIDATVIPWEVTAPLKVAEIVHNHTTFPDHSLYVATMGLFMNKDRYESLTEEQQAAIDSVSGLEFSGFAGATMQEDDAPGLKIAQDLGNNIIDLSPEEIQSWMDASQSTVDDWIAEMNSEGFDGQALVDEAKALIEEFAE